MYSADNFSTHRSKPPRLLDESGQSSPVAAQTSDVAGTRGGHSSLDFRGPGNTIGAVSAKKALQRTAGGTRGVGPRPIAAAGVRRDPASADDFRASTPISAECERLLAFVRKKCPGLLPTAPLPAGTVAPPINIKADQAVRLFPAAAAIAAGIDPFSTEPALALVKWQEGDRELVIYPSKVSARFANGVIAVTIAVSTDQTGDAAVFVSFVVGSPKQPAGLVATTSARPIGPAVIVDSWSKPLIAFAWHVVLEVVANLAGAAGRDVDGSRLVPIALAASPNGLSIVPMARHTFDRRRG